LNLTKIKQFIQSRQRPLKLEQIQVSHHHVPNTFHMNKRKILIVDDELNIRETIEELLTITNYDTKTANNGQEALDVLENWTPDLIICDIMMPVMDGQDFQKIIYSDKLLSTIPFVFLTAKTADNLMRQCFDEGADDFLTKPFKTTELLRTIELKIDKFKKLTNSTNFYIGDQKILFHEINTPLHSILGSINILMDDTIGLEKQDITFFYEGIKTSCERLNRTMHNIALFENIKNNKCAAVNNSSSEIKDVFKSVSHKISSHYVNQKSRIVSTLITAELAVSKNNLTFILFELIDNGLKFSTQDKKVIIEGIVYSEDYYQIDIFDSGVGFKKEELKLIDGTVQFNRDKTEQQGLGLGLYITKHIIKKSDGIITILSEENEGTKVSIILPIHKNLKK
jgi:two-component system sensor histidine kinase/response regulator